MIDADYWRAGEPPDDAPPIEDVGWDLPYGPGAEGAYCMIWPRFTHDPRRPRCGTCGRFLPRRLPHCQACGCECHECMPWLGW